MLLGSENAKFFTARIWAMMKNLRLVVIELSEFDVWAFSVVSGPSDPDIVEPENLDGENLSISGSRS